MPQKCGFAYLCNWVILTTSIIDVTGISLDKPTLTLVVGKDYTLIATITPNNATKKTVTWISDDDTKATVTNGKVIAVSVGVATITAKAGNQTATCIVTVENDPLTYDEGVIINGVKWATRNVATLGTFAANTESTGMFYQWNRKKAWSVASITGWDTTSPGGDTWEKTNDPSPIGWRVPTLEEFQKLLDTEKVKYEWTSENYVNGGRFTDIATGNSLFLPAVGNLNPFDGKFQAGSLAGYYWSSTTEWSSAAYGFFFHSDGIRLQGLFRTYGFGIRSVAE